MSLNAIINHLSMTDEEIEKAAQAHAEQHFVDNALFYSQEPWDKARDHYAKTLADFAKQCTSKQWISVEVRLPEEDKRVFARVPTSEFHSGYYAVAHWDGEDWIEAQRWELIRSSHWLPIPPLNPEIAKEVEG